MCNLSDGIYNKGYGSGYDKGYDSGFDKGQDTLIDNMINENYSDEQIMSISKKTKEYIENRRNMLKEGKLAKV